MGSIREDIAGQRQLRFRLNGCTLHLFKHKGESTHHVYLKTLVYALFRDRYPDLEIEPKLRLKFPPSVASVDLTGQLQLWAQCGPVSIDQVAYVLKHTDAQEVILAYEQGDVDPDKYIASIKRQLHYRYTTDRLRVLLFQPLDEWFDPDHVEIGPEHYQLYEF